MITVEKLYASSTKVLLRAKKGGDGYYFFGESALGPYRVTTYPNHSHVEEVSVSAHLGLLRQRRSLISIQMLDRTPARALAVLLAYPRDLAEDCFDMENLVHIIGKPPDPNVLRAFNTERLVDPNEPWLAAVFASLQEHAG